MIRFVLWLILFFIVAKVFGVVLQFLRQVFAPPQKPRDGVGRKDSGSQFNDIEDADYEDITDKK
jgi:hypothetical protein